MQLHITTGSPFARKVRVLAREAGLADRIEEVVMVVSPVETDEALAHRNPLSKLPVLVLDDGTALYDSHVICEYLEALHDGPRSFPAGGPERWAALRRHALADGLLEAAILLRYEQALRPEALRWPAWSEGQRRKVSAGLEALEADVAHWPERFGLDQIGVVAVLGYLDYRFADWAWRRDHPRLAAWFERQSARPSVAQTLPR